MSKFYVLDENNNKVEAYDKEGVLTVLAQAIADGTLENIVADAAFINKVRCCVSGSTYNIAFVTQAKYNELVNTGELLKDTFYYILDDTTCDNIDENFIKLNNYINDLINQINTLSTQLNAVINAINERKLNKIIECTTLDAAKKINIDYFNLVEGTELLVRFAIYGGTNTWNIMTLAVNDSVNYPIYKNNNEINVNNNEQAFNNNDILKLYFDGSKWHIKENLTKNIIYSLSNTEAGDLN